MERKRVTIQARELMEIDVDTISLVKRGANRVPFRITKSNEANNMFNLGTIFLNKKENDQPEVIGIAISDTKNSEVYVEALKSHGIVVDHVQKSEGQSAGTLMLMKSDEIPEDAVAFKVNDHSAVVVSGVKKGLESYPDATDFIENIQKAGFYPAFRTASEMLSQTIGNIMYTEGDAEITKTAVSKALKDFQGYIDAVLSTVPVNAFKAEDALHGIKKGALIGTGAGEGSKTTQDLEKEKEKNGNGMTNADVADEKAKAKEDKAADEKAAEANDGDSGEGSGDDSGEDAGGEGGEGDSGDAAGNGGEGEGEDTGSADGNSEGEDTNVSKSGDDQMATIAATLIALQKSVDGIADTVDKKIGEAIKPLNESIKTVQAGLKKTEEAVQGTVHSEESEDLDPITGVKKSDESVDWDSALDFGAGVEQA